MSHDPLFVVTSLVYALLGSTMTIMLFGRSLSRRNGPSTMWAVLAGIIGGSTIWTSHFISMLGIETAEDQLFFLFVSLGSLLLSMILVSVGFVAASNRKRGLLVEAGGLSIGIAFAVNHVMSVYALNVVGVKTFDLERLALAVLIAVAAGVLVTNRRVRSVTPYCKYGAVVAMATGIMAVHYVGISGLTISEGLPTWLSDIGISDRYLFTMVVFFGSMTLVIGGVVFMIDHHSTLDRMKALEHRAFHDRLTGLPNRFMLEEKMNEAMEAFDSIAVVTFDLNRFKSINDVHGHHAGDSVLKAVADRLRDTLEEGEMLSRTGGDEFIGIKAPASRVEAMEFAARIRSAVIKDIEWEGLRLTVGSSLGVAMFPENGTAPDDLMVKADLAMYRAKRGGKTTAVFYDPETDEPNRTKSKLQLDLRLAINRGQLELFYQKQNDIYDGRLVGYEVLLRWSHPERGYVPPDVFIPIAEKDGYITILGEWVLRKACFDAVGWATPVKIAVNVAARQLAGNDLPLIVQNALNDSGLPPSLLEIEITESGIIHDFEHALSIVKQLKELGVSIAMDDYGSGYSSLNTLQVFPFDKIKIDKAFIKELSEDPKAAAILTSTVKLGKSLNMAVLAEGIETEQHLDFLRSIGCGQGQGFFFGQPIPSAHFQRSAKSLTGNVIAFRPPGPYALGKSAPSGQ